MSKSNITWFSTRYLFHLEKRTNCNFVRNDKEKMFKKSQIRIRNHEKVIHSYSSIFGLIQSRITCRSCTFDSRKRDNSLEYYYNMESTESTITIKDPFANFGELDDCLTIRLIIIGTILGLFLLFLLSLILWECFKCCCQKCRGLNVVRMQKEQTSSLGDCQQESQACLP